eukprot:gene22635-biopygen23750
MGRLGPKRLVGGAESKSVGMPSFFRSFPPHAAVFGPPARARGTGNGRGPDADRTIKFKRNGRGQDADWTRTVAGRGGRDVPFQITPSPQTPQGRANALPQCVWK